MRAPGSLVGGRYRIVKKLASGGMGEVYVSQQLPLGREVAVKLVRLDRARDGNIVERFRREAAIVSAISHPNVVTVYDFGVDDDGSLFLAMELLHGSDLRRRLRTGALAIEDALAIARDVALGLAAAHVRGVVHRDLKPENIFLVAPSTPSGTSIAKILDFGVARGGELSHSDDEHGTASATLTSDGATVGTPGYIAPEVALGLRPTAAADHYALGVVLFEALTGQHPFMRDPAESPVATVARQLTELAPLTSSLAPNIPAALDALCTALLARDPATRPQNPAALIEELLASFRAESRASTVAAAAPVSSMRAAARPHSPRAVRIAVIAIGVVALLGLVVASRAWWLSRSPPSSVTIAACIKAKDPRVEALARDALAKEKLWRLSDAAKAWRAALAIEPSYAAANVRIVEMDALRHPAAARDDYRVALAHKRDLCPRDRAFIEAIEPVMRARVDVNDAEQRISAAAHQWPGDVALAILEATAHAAAGHTDAAVATFDRALQQAPPGDALWLAKTQLLADRGRLDDALASLDECLAKNPASVPCGGFKFTLLADAGRCDLASLAAQDFYNMSNDAFAASAVAATMLARGDRVESARAFAEKSGPLTMPTRFAFALWTGDFATAESTSESETRTLMNLAFELGDDDKALAIARAGVADAAGPLADFKSGHRLALEAVRVAAGELAPAELDRHRAEWLQQMGPLIGWPISPEDAWRDAWATPAFYRTDAPADAARAALAARAAFHLPLRPARLLPSLALLIATLEARATGAPADRTLLGIAASSCDPIDDPLMVIRAHLALAQAQEQAGDTAGARASYGFVVDRWGDSKAKSAAVAKERLRTLAAN